MAADRKPAPHRAVLAAAAAMLGLALIVLVAGNGGGRGEHADDSAARSSPTAAPTTASTASPTSVERTTVPPPVVPPPLEEGEPIPVSALPVRVGNYDRYNSTIYCADHLTSAYDRAASRWRQYVAFVGVNREPYITARSLPGGRWERPTNLRRVLGDVAVGSDAHNCLAVGVDPEGYIHVSGNEHTRPLRMARSWKPHDIATFRPVPHMIGVDNERFVTYPTFFATADGDLMFAYRSGFAGRTGSWIINRWDPAGRGGWHRVVVLTSGTDESFYPHDIAVDRSDTDTRGRIHVFGTWRVGDDTLPPPNEDLVHFYSDDEGRTWHQYGTEAPLRTPISFEDGTRVLDTQQAPRSRFILNQGGLEVDAQGRPHALVKMSTRAGLNVPRLHHVWYTGEEWEIDPLEVLGNVDRSSVVTDREGHVYGLIAASELVPDLRLIDLTPGSPTYGERVFTVAREVEYRRLSPVFDTRALYQRNVLSFVVTGLGPRSLAADDDRDPRWRQVALVVTIPLGQIDELAAGKLEPPNARVLGALGHR